MVHSHIEDSVIRRHSSTPVQSTMHTENSAEIEVCGTDECQNLVKEFNTETARYHDLVLALGGSSDSEYLRDELKKTRHNASELARRSKQMLIPHLKADFDFKSERGDYERLWNMFVSCAELYESHLRKSLELERAFPIHAGPHVLINTGVMEPVGVDNIPVNVENLEVPSVDRMVLEREDLKNQERDILELRNLISEMQRRVDIKPWMIEPLLDYKLDYEKSQSSLSDIASSNGTETTYDPHQRRKCICLVSIALLSLVAFTVVLVVCLVKFDTNK
ncbi:regulator of G-protein signaling 9-binding protein-like [Patiria miniata]|uniref:Syntaxin N-terminal domain-containing protein n=1 Tax=Patiria miniata TaxID=46514 RepID=A0A914BT50_PATMI|nr:regulator of G-protein signaling 9-binding protein-like [Patiria miniata]